MQSEVVRSAELDGRGESKRDWGFIKGRGFGGLYAWDFMVLCIIYSEILLFFISSKHVRIKLSDFKIKITKTNKTS